MDITEYNIAAKSAADGSDEPPAVSVPAAGDAPKAPEQPKAADAPKAPEQPKTADAPKAPEQPKATDAPKAPEQPKAADAPKAPEQPKAADAPKAPEQPKAADAPKAPEQQPKNGAAKAAKENTALPPAPHLSDSEVMKHTAGIWRYRSIIDDGTEQHEEYHEKRTTTPFADIIAARVRGKKHKHDGTNCDDYFETAVTDNCAVCVVCDGAGSKPLSRIGARVCAETACTFLKEQLTSLFAENDDILGKLSADLSSPVFLDGCGKVAALVRQSAVEAFSAQKKTLAELSADEKYKAALGREPILSDLSATFLAAVVVPLEADGKRQALTVSVQIGDGCICTIDSREDAEHCLRIMGEADSGAFSGETDFISEKNTRPEVLAGKTRVGRSAADCVLLMTDGVADDYFPAQPMMKRLYLDLCLNGILPMHGELSASEDPAPIFYSSVSMSRRSIALQYAKQLLSGTSPEEMNGLWDKRAALRCHSLEAFRMSIGDTPEECLRVWLDNYNERGSFDDRTLAAVILTDAGK